MSPIAVQIDFNFETLEILKKDSFFVIKNYSIEYFF